MLHISASKSVHIWTFATVTVHICTVTVALYFIFLIIFSLTSQVIFSLFLLHPLSPFSTWHSSISISFIQIIKQILYLDHNSSIPYGFLKSKSQTHQNHLQNHIIKPIYKYMQIIKEEEVVKMKKKKRRL